MYEVRNLAREARGRWLMKRFVTSEEAAKLLGIPRSTLHHYRYAKKGPTYYQLGPRTVRYQVSDLQAWTAGRGNIGPLRQRSRLRPKATPAK